MCIPANEQRELEKFKTDKIVKKEWLGARENKKSHHQFAHPDFSIVVTVPHPRTDLKIGTLKQILKVAKLKN